VYALGKVVASESGVSTPSSRSETTDALLITTSRGGLQDVGKVVAELKERGRTILI